MDSKNEIFYVSVGAAIYNLNSGEFLVLKSADEKSAYCKNFGPWELPGGRMRKGENALDGLRREIQEETGLSELEIVGPVDAGLSPQPYADMSGFLVTYLAYYTGGEVVISAEHSEYKWMSLAEIEKSDECKEWFKQRMRKADGRIRERGAR